MYSLHLLIIVILVCFKRRACQEAMPKRDLLKVLLSSFFFCQSTMIFQKIKTDPGPAPDGGTTAWLQVVAGALINALTWGYSSSFGVYQLYYTTALSLPPSQVSWIGSTQVFLTFFISAFSGRFADAGLAQQTVLLGCFLGVFGTFMTSLTTKYWQIFLAQGVCTGLGMGLMYMPSVAIISSYFQKKRGLAITTSASGSSVGSIVFPLVVQNLQNRIGKSTVFPL